jgi:flagellar motor switch protein FliG
MNELTPLPLASAEPPTMPRIIAQTNLSKRAKAAIVVRLLLNEGADIALEELPPELQAQLTQQMGVMRVVDRATVATVVQEFTTELEAIGLSFPRGIAGALDALDGRISHETAMRLRKEAGVRAAGDPWQLVCDLPAEQLLEIIQQESTEVAAVLLSKLEVPVAASLLGKLSGPEARRITYAVSLTSEVTPEAVDRIGLSLAAQFETQKIPAFETDALERLGAILNSASTPTRDDVLNGLDETDQKLAQAVRKSIFTFAHIPARVAPRDIPRVLREVDGALLITAMVGAESAGCGDSRDFILENMSGRMADQLREDIDGAGKIKSDAADEAMFAIVSAVRQMEECGDLVLIVEEEEEEE